MRYLLIIFTLLYSPNLICQENLPPIGGWREHLPYNSTIDLTEGANRVFAATPFSLFSVDLTDKTVQRFTRISGLSETGISRISYDKMRDRLIIAYTNSNIDILTASDIVNIPDIKRDNIIGDKNIYNIHIRSNSYYLSTGIGIIVIDGERAEIKDSWLIGDNGNQLRINDFNSDANYFYAATAAGLKRAPILGINLADYSNWEILSGSNGLAATEAKNIFIVGQKPVVLVNDSLYIQNGNQWTLFYGDGWPIKNATFTGNHISVSERRNSGEARVIFLKEDGIADRVLAQSPAISNPQKAILINNEPWVADLFQSLSHFTGSSFESYKLNSPEAVASGEMIVSNGVFYATAGEVNEAWNYQYNGNGVYILKEGLWSNINRYRFPQLDSMLDFITVAIDRSDQSVWAGSYGGGLLHVKGENDFTILKQGVLAPAIGDPTSYRVSGLAFDIENNLWLSNYGATQPLLVKKMDGSWQNFTVPFLLPENGLTQILVDDLNYKWIVAAKGGGLICFDHGASIDNTGDDHWRRFVTGTGSGNLPEGNVLSIAKDHNGFIWVGTTDGVGIIQCGSEIFSGQGCDAVWPVIKQGNFSGYLLKGEEVRGIAVDGADRKWIATKNGVWLINSNGEAVIYHFTEENSSLLSNDVKKVTIDKKSGEIYFATSKGICSYRGTATAGNEKNSGILVFPNPVPPNYSGTIAIRGLVDNAIVKITEMDGRLVYQTRALGGQAVWNGKDYKGRKISSGVYLVLVSDEQRKEKAVSKIVFIGK